MVTIGKLVRNGNGTQVTIPKTMLEHLQWLPGEQVLIVLGEGNAVSLHRVEERELLAAAARSAAGRAVPVETA